MHIIQMWCIHPAFFFLCLFSFSPFGASLIAPRILSSPVASGLVGAFRSSRADGRALRFRFLPNAESNNLSISSPSPFPRLDGSLGGTSVEGFSDDFSGEEMGTDFAWPSGGEIEASLFDACRVLQASGSLFSNSEFIFRTKYFPYCDPAKFCS